MTFEFNNKKHIAATAVEIVREIQKNCEEYSSYGASIRDFIEWSLVRFGDQIHARELVIASHVSEENAALNYLCLLDEHGIGSFSETRETQK